MLTSIDEVEEEAVQVRVFVDYDNLSFFQKRAGMLDLATKVLMARPLKTQASHGRCEIRIYGGWYEGATLTPLAQGIAVEIQDHFPTIIRCETEEDHICSIATQAEMAFALIEEPSNHLLDTYRKKRPPHNLRITEPTKLGCSEAHCPLSALTQLFQSQECSEPSCHIKLNDVIYRSEQKLVDTMLTCDIIQTATQGHDLIIVVSDDDDLLPSIRTATLRGTAVLRIHPKPFAKAAVFPLGGAAFFEQAL